MTAVHTQQQNAPDVQKIFAAIALIISRREEANVSLISVRHVQPERKAG